MVKQKEYTRFERTLLDRLAGIEWELRRLNDKLFPEIDRQLAALTGAGAGVMGKVKTRRKTKRQKRS